MSDELTERQSEEEAVARCLAHLDGVFIDATIWEQEQQGIYRARARRILQTIDNVRGGNHTGGLSPRRPVIPIVEVTVSNPSNEKTISTHFTKASADTACSKRLAGAPGDGKSSGHARVKYRVRPTGKKWGKRWQVVAQ